VIGHDGEQLGIIPAKKAMELAALEHLDLVEVGGRTPIRLFVK